MPAGPWPPIPTANAVPPKKNRRPYISWTVSSARTKIWPSVRTKVPASRLRLLSSGRTMDTLPSGCSVQVFASTGTYCIDVLAYADNDIAGNKPADDKPPSRTLFRRPSTLGLKVIKFTKNITKLLKNDNIFWRKRSIFVYYLILSHSVDAFQPQLRRSETLTSTVKWLWWLLIRSARFFPSRYPVRNVRGLWPVEEIGEAPIPARCRQFWWRSQ